MVELSTVMVLPDCRGNTRMGIIQSPEQERHYSDITIHTPRWSKGYRSHLRMYLRQVGRLRRWGKMVVALCRLCRPESELLSFMSMMWSGLVGPRGGPIMKLLRTSSSKTI